jgi:hypothetical protein
MAADDYLEPEVAVAATVTAVVTAAVCSPPVRKVLRRGLVYGLAGLMIARDKVADAAKSVARNVQEVTQADGNAAEAATNQTVSSATS